MHEPIEDGVRHRRFTEPLVPVLDRQLTVSKLLQDCQERIETFRQVVELSRGDLDGAIAQKEVYKRIIRACLKERNYRVIGFWGSRDDKLPDITAPTDPRGEYRFEVHDNWPLGTLFDEADQPKPAYCGVLEGAVPLSRYSSVIFCTSSAAHARTMLVDMTAALMGASLRTGSA